MAAAEPAPAEPLLRATRVVRRFGGLAAVDTVSIDLHVGEIHAVIGTNGAGKSTLVNLLSGELAMHEGRVDFRGHDVTHWSQPRRARAGLGRSYQRTTIFPEFSVLENCRLAAQSQAPRPWAFWEQAGGDRPSVAAAMSALDAAGLVGSEARIAGTLSHGAKRQLEIAMCLATSPRALLLDEPLAGMGAEETDRMLTLLSALKASQAILLVEHDMDAVFRIADRITVMVNGQVIASDLPDRIRADRAVQQAYLGDGH
ncbi:MAG: ABC transporter ATP-binding protein [Pseudomonadota bacterium]|nr:ABC transporter ATP-binding protein [Pseudomonadota bacterium]